MPIWTRVSAQDGEKFGTPTKMAVPAQVNNSGILTGNTVSAQPENTGIAGMTSATGISGVSTLMPFVKKQITTRMTKVSVLNGLVRPLERRSMNSSKRSMPSLQLGTRLLLQSFWPTKSSLSGKNQKTSEWKLLVSLRLQKSRPEGHNMKAPRQN